MRDCAHFGHTTFEKTGHSKKISDFGQKYLDHGQKNADFGQKNLDTKLPGMIRVGTFFSG